MFCTEVTPKYNLVLTFLSLISKGDHFISPWLDFGIRLKVGTGQTSLEVILLHGVWLGCPLSLTTITNWWKECQFQSGLTHHRTRVTSHMKWHRLQPSLWQEVCVVTMATTNQGHYRSKVMQFTSGLPHRMMHVLNNWNMTQPCLIGYGWYW